MACRKHFFNIVLVGKTGNGKSATGNSILRREAFDDKMSSSSSTKHCMLESATHDNFRLHVLDTPGLFDTNKSESEILQHLVEIMSLCPEGIDAFLLVLSCRSRFTEEEYKTFCIVRDFFGSNFLDVCIIVFTHGDVFHESVQIPFKKWLQDSRNEKLLTLLKECDNRMVLFYNNNSMKEKREISVRLILKLIGNIEIRYTHENFSQAERLRQNMAIEDKLPQLQAKYQREISLIIAEMEQVGKNVSHLRDEVIESLNSNVDHVLSMIDEEESGTGQLNDFREQILILKSMIDGLQKQKIATEQLQKIKEYTDFIKNPPKDRWIVLPALGLVGSTVGAVISGIGSIVFPPLVALATAAGISVGANVAGIVKGASAKREFYKKKKEMLNDIATSDK